MKKIIYKDIDEIVYKTTLKNKMKVILLYKPGFLEKDAYIVSNFGHFDCVRTININGKEKKISYGVAHFLEHRMFSIGELDASILFSNNGAESNAYTTYEKTVYYFTCNKLFYENLSILLTMVGDFTSTKEQVEKEKPIILEEANSYKEEPGSVMYKTLYKNAYKNHPINKEIIGTTKSIKGTSVEELKAVFDKFYDPSNLTLVVCGDINPNELEKFLNDNLISVKNPQIINRVHFKEPDTIIKDLEEVKLKTIDTPRVGMLFKLKQYEDLHKKERMYFCYNLVMDYLFANSGIMTEKWLKEGILTSVIDYSITCNIDLDNIIIYNINKGTDLLINKLNELFNSNNTLSMTKEDLDALKKSNCGNALKAYDSVNDLSQGYVFDMYYGNATSYFDEISEIRSISLEECNEAFKNICNACRCSVILRGDRI